METKTVNIPSHARSFIPSYTQSKTSAKLYMQSKIIGNLIGLEYLGGDDIARDDQNFS